MGLHMRYLTRERLRQLQDHIGIHEAERDRQRRLASADAAWKVANHSYVDYIRAIRNVLPSALQELTETDLHDAIIMSVGCLDRSVEMALDTTHCASSSNKSALRLRFGGTSFSAGLADVSGRVLLYDEVFLGARFYEYSALLDRGELVIRFEELEITRDKNVSVRPTPS